MKRFKKIVTGFFVLSVVFGVCVAVMTWQWLPGGEHQKVLGIPFGTIANIPQTPLSYAAFFIPLILFLILVRLKKW